MNTAISIIIILILGGLLWRYGKSMSKSTRNKSIFLFFIFITLGIGGVIAGTVALVQLDVPGSLLISFVVFFIILFGASEFLRKRA
ncbi:hypothetical protein [Halobacillus litoralis]|uniref:hypothetical protein n=1 Tax=Halobacillus litoralis TaxID=45668 RepID=UPI001CFCBAFA|nr:hypothetical protein [Halobacillus litoralis]